MLVHKPLHQRRFADPSLSTDQHSPPVTGSSCAQEFRQLIETVVSFEKVHRASSALSRDFQTKIPGKR
jgi:hypothetical protein